MDDLLKTTVKSHHPKSLHIRFGERFWIRQALFESTSERWSGNAGAAAAEA